MQAFGKSIAKGIEEMSANPDSEAAAKRVEESVAAAMWEDPALREMVQFIADHVEDAWRNLANSGALDELMKEF